MTRIEDALCAGVLLFFSLCTSRALGQVQNEAGTNCLSLGETVTSQLANGHSEPLEQLLSSAQSSNAGPVEHACAGFVLTKVASSMMFAGRLVEAEMYGTKSTQFLEQVYPPGDRVFLRPLNIIAAARFERGQIGRAKEAFKKMQALHLEWPEDSTVLHAFAGSLLTLEKRYPDAEAEYLSAIHSWEDSALKETSDTGSLYTALASVYVKEQRLEEAQRALDRALSIFTAAKDTVPTDLCKALEVRAAVAARQHRWREAEKDLGEAASLASDLPGLDPIFLERILVDYAAALRKNHRRREAGSIEARVAILKRQAMPNRAIDTSELFGQAKRKK